MSTRFAVVIGLLAVAWLLPGHRGVASEPVPQPLIEIYTSTGCGYCKTLKRYLAVRGLEYVEHNINATLETREAFHAMGGRGTPMVVIGATTIHGFNPLAIESALDAARESPAAPASAADRAPEGISPPG